MKLLLGGTQYDSTMVSAGNHATLLASVTTGTLSANMTLKMASYPDEDTFTFPTPVDPPSIDVGRTGAVNLNMTTDTILVEAIWANGDGLANRNVFLDAQDPLNSNWDVLEGPHFAAIKTSGVRTWVRDISRDYVHLDLKYHLRVRIQKIDGTAQTTKEFTITAPPIP